jgi:hypothetical protein
MFWASQVGGWLQHRTGEASNVHVTAPGLFYRMIRDGCVWNWGISFLYIIYIIYNIYI